MLDSGNKTSKGSINKKTLEDSSVLSYKKILPMSVASSVEAPKNVLSMKELHLVFISMEVNKK